jgi:hypothetical protein
MGCVMLATLSCLVTVVMGLATQVVAVQDGIEPEVGAPGHFKSIDVRERAPNVDGMADCRYLGSLGGSQLVLPSHVNDLEACAKVNLGSMLPMFQSGEQPGLGEGVHLALGNELDFVGRRLAGVSAYKVEIEPFRRRIGSDLRQFDKHVRAQLASSRFLAVSQDGVTFPNSIFSGLSATGGNAIGAPRGSQRSEHQPSLLAVNSRLDNSDGDKTDGQPNDGPIGKLRIPKAAAVLATLGVLAACETSGLYALVRGFDARRRPRWRRWGLIMLGSTMLLCGTVGMIPAHNLANRISAEQ